MTDGRARYPSPFHGLLRKLPATAAVAAVVAAGLSGPRAVEGAAVRAALVAAAPVPADTTRPRLRPVPARNYGDSLREPAVIRAVNGVLNATVVVDTATLQVPRGATTSIPLNLRSFRLASTTDTAYRANDPRFVPGFPGPTYRVRRGDLVRIRLINDLPAPTPAENNENCVQPQPDSVPGLTIPDVYQACFHGFNYTNIHYHGMHVTPDSTSGVVGDNVLLVIPPGDTLQYSFRIPQNQSPGTHWYHPHKHGSVAIQVANGMAGAFIVEDPSMGLDSIVRVLRMREHLVAIQQVAERMGLIGSQGELDRSPVLANGQFQPTIYMAPGEVQRWRIVNENTTRTTKAFEVSFVDLPGDEPRMFDIARDGVQFAPANYDGVNADQSLFMAPGQRLDVFVQAPRRAGSYTFQAVQNAGASRATRVPTRSPNLEMVPDTDLVAATRPPGVVLFKVVVDPALRGRNTTLPTSLPPLPAFLAGELPAAADSALVVFTDSLNQQPSQFYLGSRLNPYQRFDDNNVFVPSDTNGTAMPMVLGQTQTWKVVNNSQQLINHPFHIHINPFQVDSVVYPLGVNDPFHALYEQLNAAARGGNPIWLDVLPLPLPDTTVGAGGNGIANTAYAVITQKYDPFQGCSDGNCGPPTGYFVMHCHILGHEERGMMQVLQVVNPGQPVSPPAGHVGAGYGARQPGTGAGTGTGGGGQRGSGQGGGGQGQHRH